MNIALIILAAGKGTRMQSELPKVLHEVAGAPMLVHAMRAGRALDPKRTIIIAGHGFEAVSAAAAPKIQRWKLCGKKPNWAPVTPSIKPAPH